MTSYFIIHNGHHCWSGCCIQPLSSLIVHCRRRVCERASRCVLAAWTSAGLHAHQTTSPPNARGCSRLMLQQLSGCQHSHWCWVKLQVIAVAIVLYCGFGQPPASLDQDLGHRGCMLMAERQFLAASGSEQGLSYITLS